MHVKLLHCDCEYNNIVVSWCRIIDQLHWDPLHFCFIFDLLSPHTKLTLPAAACPGPHGEQLGSANSFLSDSSTTFSFDVWRQLSCPSGINLSLQSEAVLFVFKSDVKSGRTRRSSGESGLCRCDHHEQTKNPKCPKPEHGPTNIPSAQGTRKLN